MRRLQVYLPDCGLYQLEIAGNDIPVEMYLMNEENGSKTRPPAICRDCFGSRKNCRYPSVAQLV